MLRAFETATLRDNGKQLIIDSANKIKTELTKNINLLVVSKLDATQLLEVFAETGIVNPLATVQNILARRYGTGA